MELTRENSPSLLHPYLEEINSLYQVYIKTMELKRRRDELGGIELIKAWAYVSYAYARDIWFNLTTASWMFRDAAQLSKLTFTARLRGYRLGRDLSKAAIAEFLCDHWLDQADPSGDHC